MPDGKWQNVRNSNGSWDTSHNDLEVAVMQAIDQPPLVVASRHNLSRVIWNSQTPGEQQVWLEVDRFVPLLTPVSSSLFAGL